MLSFENIKVNGKVYYQPQEKQKQFHDAILNRAENGYREFLYGGAAKGGKSYSLRWEAHRNCLQYPRLRGLLIRSSFPELQRTHLAHIVFDLPPEIGHYNDQKHIFKYFNESVLEFGYGESRKDFEQYLSAEYDFIMVDEATTIPFEFILMLKMRLAASRSEFTPFFAAATNPGGVGHVQIRSYYVRKSGVDPELCPEYDAKQIFFLPATVYDNQILVSRDPEILRRLKALPEKERQKYLYGNWDIFEGQFFDEWFEAVHVVKKEDYLTYGQLLEFNCKGGLDYGNVTVCEYMCKDYNGNVILFDEWYDKGGIRSNKVGSLKDFAVKRGLLKVNIEADTNMWIPDQFDVAYSSVPAQDFITAGLRLNKVSKNISSPEKHRGYRVACNEAVRDYLHWEMKDEEEIIRPKLIVYERCVHFIETFPALITDEKDTEDLADNQEDHCYDAFKMGFMTLYTPRQKHEDKLKNWQRRLLEKKKKERTRGYMGA